MQDDPRLYMEGFAVCVEVISGDTIVLLPDKKPEQTTTSENERITVHLSGIRAHQLNLIKREIDDPFGFAALRRLYLLILSKIVRMQEKK